MAAKEQEPRTAKDKLVWWAKYGGIVAGLIGIIAGNASLAIGGAAVAVGGFALGGGRK